MVPHRLLHLKNGLIRSNIKPSSIAFFRSPTTLFLGTGRRSLRFLETTKLDPQPTGTAPSPVSEIIVQTVPHPAEAIVEEEEGIMNSQKESELLAMQHILGLKNAADDLKIKPKELERLERLKAAEPVFVCVDLEAFEFSQEKITEVGVSILDSRHVLGTDPAPDGSHWLSKINTRHMIIKEHKHLVNKRFVHGCPDKFNFGASELVSLKDIRNTLIELFNNPTSESLRASDNGSRKLILVGHGLSNDTAYLNKLKFAPHAKGNILQDVDTQRFVGTKKTTVGLSKLMAGLGVEPENLHNAGNDAAYTMQALVLITVQHTNDPGAYLKAVTNAKGKVDPAKQRYKEHRAKMREKKAADERARALAASSTEQTVRQGPTPGLPSKPLFTGPPRGHQQFPAARQDITRSSVETRPLPRAEQALSGNQNLDDKHYTSSVDHTPFYDDFVTGSSNGLPPSRAETTARGMAAQQLREKVGDRVPASKRIPLPKGPSLSASTIVSSSSEQAGRLVSSRKRKSSDPEPVPTKHVEKPAKAQPAEWDDDDFSISPAFHRDDDRSNRRPTRDDQRESEVMADSQPHNGAIRRIQSKDVPKSRTQLRAMIDAMRNSPDGPVRKVYAKSATDDEEPRFIPVNRSHTAYNEPINTTHVQSEASSIHENKQVFVQKEVDKHRENSPHLKMLEGKDKSGT